MMDILNITQKAYFDNSITNAEKHSHQPYAANSFNNNDEIRIPIQQQDVYTHPHNSSLYIEGKLVKDDGEASTTAKFVNNGVALLFDEIRYEIGGVVIDRVRNPGITSIMKGICSFNANESTSLEIAGWSPLKDNTIIDASGNFNVVIPLRMLFGFCEDFRKIFISLRQELVLIRSNSDVNAIVNTADNEIVKVELTKILWRIPHINVDDSVRIKLLKNISSNNELDIPFRAWELHEHPLLQQTQRQTWTIKTSTQLEKPRFVIFGFQTDRKNKAVKNYSEFDHCNLSNIKLYLNSEMYPYDNLNANFTNNQFATLYEMYANFQQSYYEKENQPLLSPYKFKSIAPLSVIDCSRQNELLKTGSVDIRLEFEATVNIPANTSAFCLILHDKLVKYNPLTSAVRIEQ